MDGSGKRRYVYAKTLEELRIKEEQIAKEIKTEASYVKKGENPKFPLMVSVSYGNIQ